MIKSDIKPALWTEAPTENKWYLKNFNSPENSGNQYFLRKCWKTEAEARHWLERAFMDDVLAIRGER